MRSILSVGPNSLNGCLSAKAATGGNPVTCTTGSPFLWAALFCGAEQDRNTTARAVFLSSGFEGSPVKSHSRRFVCVYSTRLLLAASLFMQTLRTFASHKQSFRLFLLAHPSPAPKKSYHFDTTFFIHYGVMAYHHATCLRVYHQKERENRSFFHIITL